MKTIRCPHLQFRLCPQSAIILTGSMVFAGQLFAQTTYYLDVNGATDGSGITEGGSCDAGSSIWSTAANCSVASVAHANNSPYVISAGTDAAGLNYTLTVNTGSTLELDNNITVASNPVTINGPGFNNGTINLGAIANFAGSNNYNSLVTLGSASRINNNAAGTTLTLNTAAATPGGKAFARLKATKP